MSDAAEVWRQKSDEELQIATEALFDYTEEYQKIILAELSRRSGFRVGIGDGEPEDEPEEDLSIDDSEFESTAEQIIRGESHDTVEPPPRKPRIDESMPPVKNSRSVDVNRYRVVPFAASVGTNEGSAQAAAQLESLIERWSDNGWEYVSLESVETYVAGSAGCFGIGATPAQVVSYSMVVFKR